jgi:hypothetical protein
MQKRYLKISGYRFWNCISNFFLSKSNTPYFAKKFLNQVVKNQ